MLLYVNTIEKRTGMKNTGLKIPEKDQIYVYVGFSYYLRAKIIGKSFSILYFKCKWEQYASWSVQETWRNNACSYIKIVRYLSQDSTFDLF